MGKLRVLIVSAEGVVDIQEFDDPRLRYVQDFNRLNELTPYTAVLPSPTEAARVPVEAVPVEMVPVEMVAAIRRHHDACRPQPTCRESG